MGLMPDNPIAGLYPQPPAPWDPMQAFSQGLGIVGQMNALKAFGAKQAAGQAFQSGINPDGTVDMSKVAAGLKNPTAAWAAPEAMSTLLKQRARMIANDTSAFSLAASQNSGLQNAIGASAQDPTLTPDKIRANVVTLARNSNIPTQMLTSLLAGMPEGSGKVLQNWAANIGNIAMGAAGTAQRVPGPPDPVTGAPTSIPLGTANAGGAVPTALPPGQEGALAANQGAFVADQTRAAQTLANIRPLQNAFPLIKQLSSGNFGPGSEGLAQIKGALQSRGLIPPGTSDLEVRQEANKYLHVYAGAARGVERSDQGLQQALVSNPGLDLTQGANLGLIQNQIAMDRMDAALPIHFQNTNPGPNAKAAYLGSRAAYYQNTDPRAFAFDLMTPQERATLKTSLGPPSTPQKPNPAWDKFMRSYQIAKSAGVLTPPQGANGQ
jgi:hypothetical protein